MKRITLTIVVLAISLIVGGCKVKSPIPTKTTVGDDYQVMIFCPNEAWQGDLSMAVCDVLEEDAPGLTRPQGYFDIVSQKSAADATDLDRKYGNILNIVITPTSECALTVAKNLYARPQTVVTITAPSAEAATDYVSQMTDVIRNSFEEGERQKSNTYYAARPAEQLEEYFAEHTGFEMVIPQDFFKATTRDETLLWYLRDYPTKAQYIFAFESDYTDEQDLEGRWLMMMLDNKLATISSRGAVGSYMGVNERDPYYTCTVDVNGREWVELRGHWEVNNDFMGGSFVSYTTLDAERNKLTTVMFALYAPEDPQRNLLRELEHLIYTIE